MPADYGDWAAQQLHDYGCKLGLRSPRCGRLTPGPLLAARPHNLHPLDALVAGFVGLVPGDQGCIDAFRHALVPTRHDSTSLTPAHARMAPPPYSKAVLQASARWRQRLETVGSQWTERFAIARLRGRELWHFQHRVIRKVVAQTVCVGLNLPLGRAPLDLDGLVCA